MIDGSVPGSREAVVSKHPTETLTTCHGTINRSDFGPRIDQAVADTWMGSLVMRVRKELADRVSQRPFNVSLDSDGHSRCTHGAGTPNRPSTGGASSSSTTRVGNKPRRHIRDLKRPPQSIARSRPFQGASLSARGRAHAKVRSNSRHLVQNAVGTSRVI